MKTKTNLLYLFATVMMYISCFFVPIMGIVFGLLLIKKSPKHGKALLAVGIIAFIINMILNMQ